MCPYCKTMQTFVKIGIYTRNVDVCHEVQTQVGSQWSTKSVPLDVQRIKCKGCKHTHALHPSFLIPYSRRLVSTILDAISIAFNPGLSGAALRTILELSGFSFEKTVQYTALFVDQVKKIMIPHNAQKWSLCGMEILLGQNELDAVLRYGFNDLLRKVASTNPMTFFQTHRNSRDQFGDIQLVTI